MSDNDIANTRRKKIVTFLIHLLCLVILFVIPEVLFNYGHPNHNLSVITYCKAAIFVIVFYVEYYLLLPAFALKKVRIVRFIFMNLLLVIAGEFLLYLLMHFFHEMLPAGKFLRDEDFWFFRQISGMLKDGAMLILTISLAVALRLTDHWIKNETKLREEESVRRHQELEGLRNQLNPHFLFNTLNSIYALIAISPDGAQEAVHKLSKLLRHVLYENPALVTLESEAAFMDNYMKLQALRMPADSQMVFETDISGYSDSYVPSMLFVTLLENVYKHADLSKPVSIKLEVKDNNAVFVTRNRCKNRNQSSPGIGLYNLKRRLELLFGNKAHFTTQIIDEVFVASLVVPLRNSLSKDFNHS